MRKSISVIFRWITLPVSYFLMLFFAFFLSQFYFDWLFHAKISEELLKIILTIPIAFVLFVSPILVALSAISISPNTKIGAILITALTVVGFVGTIAKTGIGYSGDAIVNLIQSILLIAFLLFSSFRKHLKV